MALIALIVLMAPVALMVLTTSMFVTIMTSRPARVAGLKRRQPRFVLQSLYAAHGAAEAYAPRNQRVRQVAAKRRSLSSASNTRSWARAERRTRRQPMRLWQPMRLRAA